MTNTELRLSQERSLVQEGAYGKTDEVLTLLLKDFREITDKIAPGSRYA
jgi:hypothetical protein